MACGGGRTAEWERSNFTTGRGREENEKIIEMTRNLFLKIGVD